MAVLPPSTVLDEPGSLFFVLLWCSFMLWKRFQHLKMFPSYSSFSLTDTWHNATGDAAQGLAHTRQALASGLHLLTRIANCFR